MIEVSVKKAWPQLTLDASFVVPARGVTALFGRSGSGKTSILQAIGGGLTPDAGRIVIDGRVFFDSAAGIVLPIHERGIGYVFQDSGLFPHLSVRGNLRYGLSRAKREARIGFEAVTALLGIGQLLDRRPHKLSGGERQRVAIGRALLSQPALLLMDEPLASLDPPRASELLSYIERLRDELGLPILYISHVLDEAIRLADQLVLVEGGRVARAGPLLEVISDPAFSPLIGRFEAGAVLECCVVSHDDAMAASTLAFDGGELRLPRVEVAAGGALRVRIRARDVSLALSEPRDVSITNRLSGTLVSLVARDGPYVDAGVAVGGVVLRALITRESVARLGLAPGMPVWALIKTVAFDSRSAGQVGPERA